MLQRDRSTGKAPAGLNDSQRRLQLAREQLAAQTTLPQLRSATQPRHWNGKLIAQLRSRPAAGS